MLEKESIDLLKQSAKAALRMEEILYSSFYWVFL
jgi:hypothetical protein